MKIFEPPIGKTIGNMSDRELLKSFIKYKDSKITQDIIKLAFSIKDSNIWKLYQEKYPEEFL